MGRIQSGKRGHNWKGGIITDPQGYVMVHKPDHPAAKGNGYVYQHRLVAEEHLGRYLLPTERVHHRNHNKADNRWENLEVCEDVAHHLFHHRTRTDLRLPDEPNRVIRCSCGCHQLLLRFDRQGRPRDFVWGHNMRSRKAKPPDVSQR
jgi:hypothetical protein